MIQEPNCWKRHCRNFLGVKNDGDETSERVYCRIYPDRIPDGIAYGDDSCKDFKNRLGAEPDPEEEDEL
jgi:hypothetical protein